MARAGRRITGAAAALVILASMTGCVFLIPDSLRAVSEFRRFADVVDQSLQVDGPEIDITLNAAGGDAISVYLPDAASRRFRIAEETAGTFGIASPVAEQDVFEPDTATVQLESRLVTRGGDDWNLSFDTTRISSIVHGQGYEGYYLFLCHPAVKARVDASVPQDITGVDSYCFHGGGWTIVDEEVEIRLTLLPEISRYLAYLAGVILGVVLLGGIALLVGDKLRRGPFRRRNAGAVALGLIVGIIVAGVGLGAAASAGAGAGPADNLALAKDLGVGLYALSVALPTLFGAIPGIIFAVLLVRKRPWRDDPEPEAFRGWPAPPPPGGPGSPPPPPIPFGVR
jgi:hypothetical protein